MSKRGQRSVAIPGNEGDSATGTGIYAIVCEATRGVYVGQTVKAFNDRWRIHWQNLRRGNHNNKSLQTAFNTNGPDAIRFVVLEQINFEGFTTQGTHGYYPSDIPPIFFDRETYWQQHYQLLGYTLYSRVWTPHNK